MAVAEAAIGRARDAAAELLTEARRSKETRVGQAMEYAVERLLLAFKLPGCIGCGHRDGNHSTSCRIGCSDCSGVNGEHERGCWHKCLTCGWGHWIERWDNHGRDGVKYECGHVVTDVDRVVALIKAANALKAEGARDA